MIIVFDLDGTLIDSARDLAESVGELLESYGASPLPLDEVVKMVGEGAPILVRRAMERRGIEPDARDALARFMRIYNRRLMNHTLPYPGTTESLACVLQRGPLAVLTNKPLGPTIGLLESLHLRGFFSRIIGGDSDHGRKPNPTGLLSLQSLAPGERLVMVGDSPADYNAAVNAGCVFVLARFGFGARKFDAPPDTPYAIDHPRELAAVLNAVGV